MKLLAEDHNSRKRTSMLGHNIVAALGTQIVADLESALDQFATIAEDLKMTLGYSKIIFGSPNPLVLSNG